MTDKTPNPGAAPISNGVNARPRNESIAQTASGLPNDSGSPVEIDEVEVERIKRKLLGEVPEDDTAGRPA